MACKNKQCRCRNWCAVNTQDMNDPDKCVQAITISTWWKAKVAGIRDPDEDFTEEDFEDG